MRVLTRLLPFIYESEKLETWEEQFFWTPRRKRVRDSRGHGNAVMFDGDGTTKVDTEDEPEFHEVKPLAEELIDTLIDMLFFIDFTLPRIPGKHDKVHLSIWQNGVGCNSAIATSKELENNRMEVLRLLLTLSSKSMYTTASETKFRPTTLELQTHEHRRPACPGHQGHYIHDNVTKQATGPHIALLSIKHGMVSLTSNDALKD